MAFAVVTETIFLVARCIGKLIIDSAFPRSIGR